jgi:membrane protein DedA with SNARE-associated domain
MDLSALIVQYGYFALFAGCLIEGETLLILAGFAAHEGYLQLHWVLLIAMIGGFLGDQFYFWLGRRHGAWVLYRFPRLAIAFARADVLILRYHELLIVGIRFLYGLRTIGPMALGMSQVSSWRFMAFNALGAVIWAVSIGGAGFLFGRALEIFWDNLKKVEDITFIILLLAGLIIWLWRRYKFSKNLKNSDR